jgi:hypothetical protein
MSFNRPGTLGLKVARYVGGVPSMEVDSVCALANTWMGKTGDAAFANSLRYGLEALLYVTDAPPSTCQTGVLTLP